MNKSESDKLLDAIGGVNDRWVKELMEEPAVKASPKTRPIVKRIVIAAAAALLSISLVITVAANSDAIIAAMFERRQNLVDNKIGHIDESVTEGNITLTMESVAVDRKITEDGHFVGKYTVSFRNEDGNFDGGLKYDGYRLEYLVDADSPLVLNTDAEVNEDGRKWYVFSNADAGTGACPFDVDLEKINYGLDYPTDTVTISGQCFGRYNDDFRLTFINLTSYDGSKKYADELSVEFNVSEDAAQPLQQLDRYNPEATFEIEGVTFEAYDIDINTQRMNIKIANPNADRVNLAGTDCYAINYFTKLSCSDEYIEKTKQLIGVDVNSEEGINLTTEIFMLSLPSADRNVLNECYEILVELDPESGAEVTSISTGYGGFVGESASSDNIFANMYAEFSSPIYVEDIVRVYAQKIGDPTKQVTVWVPAQDKGLDASR